MRSWDDHTGSHIRVDPLAGTDDAPALEMTDLQSELEALSREFAASLAAIVKKAALESVAEIVKHGTSTAASVPDENDAPSNVPLGDAVRTPAVDAAVLPLESWPERPSSPRPSPVADRVLFFVRAKPGRRSQEIRAALGLDQLAMRAAIEALLTDGRIVRNGKGGGMTYRAS